MNSKTIMDATVEQFDISVTRGFLPEEDPSQLCPPEGLGHPRSLLGTVFIEDFSFCAQELPNWIAAGCVRREIKECNKYLVSRNTTWATDLVREANQREIAWLMRTLSFLAHAWVWGGIGEGHTDHIPSFLSVPWCAVAEKLGRSPMLSYDSYALENWHRFDPKKPIELGNLCLIQTFLGGLDEKGFILQHVEIEARGAPIPVRSLELVKATVTDNPTYAIHCFDGVVRSLAGMNATMKRMPEWCDPYIYYKRVRPYIHGWKENPALPNGVVYEGCFGDVPQQFRGETGAQSALFPTLYALLGVRFKNDLYLEYLREMREYMPLGHRKFIEFLEEAEQGGFSVWALVENHKTEYPWLGDRMHEVLGLMVEFLETHIGYASSYIHKQSQKSEANPTAVGTGGTPFMPYLAEHIDHLKEIQSSL